MTEPQATLNTKKAIWQFGGLGASALLQLGQLLILSRVLPPQEYASVAIVNVFLGIVMVFSDFGATNYIIYKRDFTRQEYSSIYWLNIIAGAVLSVLMMLIAYPVSRLYENSALFFLISLAASTLFITSLSSQIQTVMIRDYRLELLARSEFFSKLLGTALTIKLALGGHGAAAVVYGNVCATTTKVMYQLLTARRNDYPTFIFSLASTKEAARFGYNNIAARLVNAIRLNADTAIIGLNVSAQDLGLFSMARQLISATANVFNPLISRLSLPYLSSARDNNTRILQVDNAYRYSIYCLVPFYSFIALKSELVAEVLLGDTYQGGSSILAWFSIFWMARLSIGSIQSSLVQSVGRSDLDMRWALMVTPVHLCVVFVASLFEIEWVAISLAILQVGSSLVAVTLLLNNICDYKISRIFKHLAGTALLVVAPASMFIVLYDHYSPHFQLPQPVQLIVTAGGYFFIVLMIGIVLKKHVWRAHVEKHS